MSLTAEGIKLISSPKSSKQASEGFSGQHAVLPSLGVVTCCAEDFETAGPTGDGTAEGW